jgi:hypothetical protein
VSHKRHATEIIAGKIIQPVYELYGRSNLPLTILAGGTIGHALGVNRCRFFPPLLLPRLSRSETWVNEQNVGCGEDCAAPDSLPRGQSATVEFSLRGQSGAPRLFQRTGQVLL